MRRRLHFLVIAALALGASLVQAEPAQACWKCDFFLVCDGYDNCYVLEMCREVGCCGPSWQSCGAPYGYCETSGDRCRWA